MNKLAQGVNTAAQDSNPGSLSRESGGLPLSHCALRNEGLHTHLSQLITMVSRWLSVILLCSVMHNIRLGVRMI